MELPDILITIIFIVTTIWVVYMARKIQKEP